MRSRLHCGVGGAEFFYPKHPHHAPQAAPADDPRVAVLIMINKPDPRLGYYGSVVAAPGVREVLAATLAYLQVPPDTGDAWSRL